MHPNLQVETYSSHEHNSSVSLSGFEPKCDPSVVRFNPQQDRDATLHCIPKQTVEPLGKNTCSHSYHNWQFGLGERNSLSSKAVMDNSKISYYYNWT